MKSILNTLTCTSKSSSNFWDTSRTYFTCRVSDSKNVCSIGCVLSVLESIRYWNTSYWHISKLTHLDHLHILISTAFTVLLLKVLGESLCMYFPYKTISSYKYKATSSLQPPK